MHSITTTHRIAIGDARDLDAVPAKSVDLIVTSPPYPMIEMWDEVFARLNPEIGPALAAEDGRRAFELMHRELDRVWKQCFRVLKPGGFACINIGDATRTLGGDFQLYSNHAYILVAMMKLGFTPLPDILWRKPTNAPNKFMGSGMLPAGAYVTYEHEYVLILRKGSKREFLTPASKGLRERSAFFWEERNVWFSDVWLDLRGAGQEIVDPETRERSGAFPLELPYRLIHMYSLQEDVVLDPFLGTGTTTLAAMLAGRSSIGVEVDGAFAAGLRGAARAVPELGAGKVRERLAAHEAFVRERSAAGKEPKHRSDPYGFPVVTKQERQLILPVPVFVEETAAGALEVKCSLRAERHPAPPPLPPPPAPPRESPAFQQAELPLFEPSG
jgi:DNA modification methylase